MHVKANVVGIKVFVSLLTERNVARNLATKPATSTFESDLALLLHKLESKSSRILFNNDDKSTDIESNQHCIFIHTYYRQFKLHFNVAALLLLMLALLVIAGTAAASSGKHLSACRTLVHTHTRMYVIRQMNYLYVLFCGLIIKAGLSFGISLAGLHRMENRIFRISSLSKHPNGLFDC